MSDEDAAANSSARRIDKWLWCARRFKTRSLAARFITEETVRVTRVGVTHRIDKPGFLLREGDVVSFLLDERMANLTVLGFADRRGPPNVARSLYVAAAAAPACKETR